MTLAASRAPTGGALLATFLEAVPDAIVGVVAVDHVPATLDA